MQKTLWNWQRKVITTILLFIAYTRIAFKMGETHWNWKRGGTSIYGSKV
jgi:hypothetical protein